MAENITPFDPNRKRKKLCRLQRAGEPSVEEFAEGEEVLVIPIGCKKCFLHGGQDVTSSIGVVMQEGTIPTDPRERRKIGRNVIDDHRRDCTRRQQSPQS